MSRWIYAPRSGSCLIGQGYGRGFDSDKLSLGYNVSSYWIGQISVPDGEPVLVGVFDANLDAVFNNGALKFDSVFRVERGSDEYGRFARTSLRGLRELEELRDYACVDLNRDGELNDCGDIGAFEEDNEMAPMYSGEPFMLDGRSCTLDVTPTGHRVGLAC